MNFIKAKLTTVNSDTLSTKHIKIKDFGCFSCWALTMNSEQCVWVYLLGRDPSTSVGMTFMQFLKLILALDTPISLSINTSFLFFIVRFSLFINRDSSTSVGMTNLLLLNSYLLPISSASYQTLADTLL